MEKQKIEINVPANLRYSSLIRHIADEVFGFAKFNKAWCSRLKLVVDELFMNAVKYGSTEDKSVVAITFLYDETEIQFIIEDDGTGPQAKSAEELEKIIQANEQKNADLTRTSGRGLAMITKLWTDGMQVTTSERGGIAASFVKKIETAEAAPPPMPPPTSAGTFAEASAPEEAPAGKPSTGVPVAPPSVAPAPQATSVPTSAGTFAEASAPEEALAGKPSAPAKTDGPVYEIKLSGEIDQSNITEKVAPIYDQIEAMPDGAVLQLDFSDLDYINSTFIGSLAAWHTSLLSKGGSIRLKGVNNEIKEVLELVGLSAVLEFENLKT